MVCEQNRFAGEWKACVHVTVSLSCTHILLCAMTNYGSQQEETALTCTQSSPDLTSDMRLIHRDHVIHQVIHQGHVVYEKNSFDIFLSYVVMFPLLTCHELSYLHLIFSLHVLLNFPKYITVGIK